MNELLLQFSALDEYVGFVMSCFDEPRTGPGSDVYTQLQQFGRQQGQAANRYFVRVRGDREQLQVVLSLARANAGERDQSTHWSNLDIMTFKDLSRRIVLHRHTPPVSSESVVCALCSASADVLSLFLGELGELNLTAVDIAFTRQNPLRYTHLVRIQGNISLVELESCFGCLTVEPEVFLPIRQDDAPIVYVRSGFRYPIHNIDQLLCTPASDVILIRPVDPADRHQGNLWMPLSDEFRRRSQAAELELSHTIPREILPLIAMDEQPVKLELSLRQRQEPMATAIELERKIARAQEHLADLSRRQHRIANPNAAQLMFAYRFNQPADGSINPALAVLLQQRIGILRNFEYSYCEPRDGTSPFHVLLSTMPQPESDYSIYHADQVYYQPINWRRANVPLFIPWGMELAPRIDGDDAIEMLHNFLDNRDGQERLADSSHASAILWEGNHERLSEIRVVETTPLLDHFQVLNEFDQQTAKRIADQTEQRHREQWERVREQCHVHLESMAIQLFQQVHEQTREVRTDFDAMLVELARVEELVRNIQEFAKQVTQLLSGLPREWADFVSEVLVVHRQIMNAPMASLEDLKRRLAPNRRELRMLGMRGQDLAELGREQRSSIEDGLEQCRQRVVQSGDDEAQVAELCREVERVAAQVCTMHENLADRLGEVEAQRRLLEEMQTAIANCESDERRIANEITRLDDEFRQATQRNSELQRIDETLSEQEMTLQAKTAEIAAQQRSHERRLDSISAQLQALANWQRRIDDEASEAARLSELLAEETQLVGAQNGALMRWAEQAESWRQRLASEIGSNGAALSESGQALALISEAANLLAKAGRGK